MSDNFKTALIWLLGSVVVLAATLHRIPAVLVEGEFLPYGVDSFYHARRVLETMADPAGRLWEFDPRSYAPEGTWHTWPWLYDWLLVQSARLGMALSNAQNPLAILIYIPPLFGVVNTGLVLAIAQSLGFSRLLQILAVLAFAASPLTLQLHLPGRIDHHFMELTCVLGTLLAGLAWFQRPDDARRALAMGLVVGIAPGMQNGLFILQLPVLVTLGILWLRNRERPGIGAMNAFSLGLGGITVAILLPSDPFWEGRFLYYALSWFHLYIAFCVIIMAQALARTEPSVRSALLLLVSALFLLWFMLDQAQFGVGFITGDLDLHAALTEMVSLPTAIRNDGLWSILEAYSLLFLTLPVILLVVARWPFMRVAPERIFFALMALGGCGLMIAMHRLHYFGSFALIFGPLLGWRWLTERLPNLAWTAPLLLAGAYLPVLPILAGNSPVGGTAIYAMNREIFPAMERACAERPGIVLAPPDFGHFITYHTACSVLANNMLLTPQHAAGFRLAKGLLAGPVRAIREDHPEIAYVYVFAYGMERGVNAGEDVLPTLFRTPPPAGFELLKEVTRPLFPGAPVQRITRLFRVVREE